MGISRRQFLGWLSAAGVGMTTGDQAKAASNKTFGGYPGAYGILHDTTRCIGCRKCEEACNRVNELPSPDRPFDDLAVLDNPRRTTAAAFTIVNRFESDDGGPAIFAKDQCNHCLEPACASAGRSSSTLTFCCVPAQWANKNAAAAIISIFNFIKTSFKWSKENRNLLIQNQ